MSELRARVDTYDPSDSIYGKKVQCFQCTMRFHVDRGPFVVVGNNEEGPVGILCPICSKRYIRKYLPEEAKKHGLYPSEEEIRRRNKEIKKFHEELERDLAKKKKKIREENRRKGNMCIRCHKEPNEGLAHPAYSGFCHKCLDEYHQRIANGEDIKEPMDLVRMDIRSLRSHGKDSL